jgi:hypothetical protein
MGTPLCALQVREKPLLTPSFMFKNYFIYFHFTQGVLDIPFSSVIQSLMSFFSSLVDLLFSIVRAIQGRRDQFWFWIPDYVL